MITKQIKILYFISAIRCKCNNNFKSQNSIIFPNMLESRRITKQLKGKNSVLIQQKSLGGSLGAVSNQQLIQVQSQNNGLMIHLEYILGTSRASTKSANIYPLNQKQLIYYVNSMFVIYNTETKQYQLYEEPRIENGRIIAQNSTQNIEKSSSKVSKQVAPYERRYPIKDAQLDEIKQQSTPVSNTPNFQYKLGKYSSMELIITKLFLCKNNEVFIAIKRVEKLFYLSVFWISLRVTSIYKLNDEQKQFYTNFTFHSKKGYIYLLYKLVKTGQGNAIHSNQLIYKQQYLKIIQIKPPNSQSDSHQSNLLLSSQKQRSNTNTTNSHTQGQFIPKLKILLDCCIRKTGGGAALLDDLIVSDDHTQLYIYGNDYFRLWTVLYNERNIRESNYRNIQRNIKKFNIAAVFWVSQMFFCYSKIKLEHGQSKSNINNFKSNCLPTQKSHNFLVIITQLQCLFVQNNQLLHITQIPGESAFRRVHREAAEVILEKSLNQIYKTKFRIENSVPTEDNEHQSYIEQKQNFKKSIKLISASTGWIEKVKDASSPALSHENLGKTKQKQNKLVKFCASFQDNKVFIYKINPDFSIKFESSINQISEHFSQVEKTSNFKFLSCSSEGGLLVLTNMDNENYLANRALDSESNDMNPLYLGGHGHSSSILSISAPEILNNFATISADGSLKIWNTDNRERNLVIDARFKLRPIGVVVHTCGFLVIVNFGIEIKIYGIISNQIEEIVSIKTNDFCSSIQLCKLGNFIVSNQKNMIKIYDPFTLHVFNKIQPDDLRLQFKKVKLSQNGEFIVYQCCNLKLFRHAISTISNPQSFSKTNNYQEQRSQNINKAFNPIFCHRQSQQYTCFYFNFGTGRTNLLASNQQKNMPLSLNNIFIGFTKEKYMAIYSKYGENLVVQFPVIDGVYVTDCCLANQHIFLATNKGTIQVYKWPILQSELQLEILNFKNDEGKKMAKFKRPKCLSQFKVWKNQSPITSLYHISNKYDLVVGGIEGLLAVVSYSTQKNNYSVHRDNGYSKPNQKKRMIESMNNLKFIKIAEIDKIIKLIEKTQNDIQKIQYEIHNEKQRKNIQQNRDQQQLKTNFDKRKKAYTEQKTLKFIDQQQELKAHQSHFQQKKQQKKTKLAHLQKAYTQKQNYQISRVNQIKQQIKMERQNHRKRIIELIESHKQKLREIKDRNIMGIKALQREFEAAVLGGFGQHCAIQQMREVQLNQQRNQSSINIQELKVQQLQLSIQKKQIQVTKIHQKCEQAKKEDEETQKLFQKNLQKYNEMRCENLVLHSELLKIQNQLYERKEILSKKDQIIKMAFQQKQINQIYKQFVSGTISERQDLKQKQYHQYIKKQQDLRMLFEQLTLQINKFSAKKLKIAELKQASKILQRESKQKKQNIKISIQKLKNLKKFLLVQGVSDDSQHKRFYQQQQKLLATIRWLQKRFKMNCINEKKISILKKCGVNQVINQNKNLLEQCNQLREEGIVYQNQIQHLSKKLSQANQIIELQKKLKNQKTSISKQTEKLAEIRKMFVDQIDNVTKDIAKQEDLVQL